MNIHHCVFKILGKKQHRGRTHGWTDRQMDGQRENNIPPQTKFAGGIISEIFNRKNDWDSFGSQICM